MSNIWCKNMKSFLGLRGRNFPPYAVGLSLSPTSTHPSHATSYATGTRKSLIYIASHRIVNLIRRYPQVFLRCLRAHRSVHVSLSSHQFFSFTPQLHLSTPQAISLLPCIGGYRLTITSCLGLPSSCPQVCLYACSMPSCTHPDTTIICLFWAFPARSQPCA